MDERRIKNGSDEEIRIAKKISLATSSTRNTLKGVKIKEIQRRSGKNSEVNVI